jgi:hypothetical protein
MSNDLIFFEKEDTLQQTAVKTAMYYAGTTELKKQMERLGVEYTKIERGGAVFFALRHKSWGRIEVKL